MGLEYSISIAPHVDKRLYHVAAASYDWRMDLDAGIRELS